MGLLLSTVAAPGACAACTFAAKLETCCPRRCRQRRRDIWRDSSAIAVKATAQPAPMWWLASIVLAAPSTAPHPKCDEWVAAGGAHQRNPLVPHRSTMAHQHVGLWAERAPALTRTMCNGHAHPPTHVRLSLRISLRRTTNPVVAECSRNPDFMEGACAAACRCARWAEAGECDRNAAWMRSNCTMACERAAATPPPPPPSLPPRPDVPPPPQTPAECEAWAAAGECERNARFMNGGACGAACRCERWAAAGECATNSAYMRASCEAGVLASGPLKSLAANMDAAAAVRPRRPGPSRRMHA